MMRFQGLLSGVWMQMGFARKLPVLIAVLIWGMCFWVKALQRRMFGTVLIRFLWISFQIKNSVGR